MAEQVWLPSLEDTAQNDLSARLRAGLTAALPEFVRQHGSGPEISIRNVEIRELAPGLTL